MYFHSYNFHPPFLFEGCGHCKNAKPEFNEAAEVLKDDPRVMLGAVDCTLEKSICETYEVRGFPTFKVFQYFNKEDVLNYEGDRNVSVLYDMQYMYLFFLFFL